MTARLWPRLRRINNDDIALCGGIAGLALLVATAGVAAAHPGACAHATTTRPTVLLAAPLPDARQLPPDLPARARLHLRSCQYRAAAAGAAAFYCKLVKTSKRLKRISGPLFVARSDIATPAATAHCQQAFRDPYRLWQQRAVTPPPVPRHSARPQPQRRPAHALQRALLAHIVCADPERDLATVTAWAEQRWQHYAVRLPALSGDPLFDDQTRAVFRAVILQRVAAAHRALRAELCRPSAPSDTPRP